MPVIEGGTGSITLTSHGVLLGEGTSAISATTAGTSGQVLLGSTAANPSFITPTAGTGLSITSNATTLAYTLSTPVSVANGGTNASSLTTTNGTLYFDGTRVVTTTTGTSGQVLTSNGAGAPTYQNASSGGISTLVGDDAGTATGATVTLAGGSNISTSGNNAATITFNLSANPSVAGSVTAGTGFTTTTGDMDIVAGNLVMPATSGTTAGIILFNGTRMLHAAGNNNFFAGKGAGSTSVSGNQNTGIGSGASDHVSSGSDNVAVGFNTLNLAGAAASNVAIGSQALANTTACTNNVAVGFQSLNGASNATSTANTALGYQSLSGISTGHNNIAIGSGSGSAYGGSESSNIVIANAGTNGESNVIRLGTTGSGTGQQAKCWVAGTRGVTTDVADAIAVLIDSTGQLGTTSSTRRVKENIQDMAQQSDGVLNLRPVTFNFISDQSKKKQYGLIAEEVNEILPELVVYDNQGLPASIKYHELPVILLNELKKLKAEIKELKERSNV